MNGVGRVGRSVSSNVVIPVMIVYVLVSDVLTGG
jgi:hypothetical protein